MSDNFIKTPIPGTFYRRPAPDKEPFKQVGDQCTEGETIGLVEVMKNFHEIKTERAGTIKIFLAEDNQPVTPGQTIAEFE